MANTPTVWLSLCDIELTLILIHRERAIATGHATWSSWLKWSLQMGTAVANVPTKRWNFYETMVRRWWVGRVEIKNRMYLSPTNNRVPLAKSANKSQHKSYAFSTGSLFTLHDKPQLSVGMPDWRIEEGGGETKLTSRVAIFLIGNFSEKNIAHNYETVSLISNTRGKRNE